MTRKIFFLLSHLLIFTASAFAKPQVKATIDYYDIEGNSAKELRREMNRKGIKEGGRNYHAHTDWHIKANYHYHPAGGYCVVEQVATAVEVTYFLPRWVNRDSAPQNLVNKWDKFYEALKLHEEGHADLGRKAAEEIESAVSKLGAVGCPNFNAKADAEVKTIVAKYRQIEVEYDKSTRHGERQGAHFT